MADAMAELAGGITGAIVGVVLLSLFLSFLIRKITRKDTPNQRVSAAVIATALSVAISSKIGLSMGRSPDWLFFFESLRMLAGVSTAFLYGLKLRGKRLLLAIIYGITFWFAISFVVGVLAAVLGVDNDTLLNVAGAVVLFISLISAGFLVSGKKLPGTRA